MLWHSSVMVFLSSLYQLPEPAPPNVFCLQLFAEIIREVYIEPVSVNTDCSWLWGLLASAREVICRRIRPFEGGSDVHIRTHSTIEVSI
jgi:hypothetical protein